MNEEIKNEIEDVEIKEVVDTVSNASSNKTLMGIGIGLGVAGLLALGAKVIKPMIDKARGEKNAIEFDDQEDTSDDSEDEAVNE